MLGDVGTSGHECLGAEAVGVPLCGHTTVFVEVFSFDIEVVHCLLVSAPARGGGGYALRRRSHSARSSQTNVATSCARRSKASSLPGSKLSFMLNRPFRIEARALVAKPRGLHYLAQVCKRVQDYRARENSSSYDSLPSSESNPVIVPARLTT